MEHAFLWLSLLTILAVNMWMSVNAESLRLTSYSMAELVEGGWVDSVTTGTDNRPIPLGHLSMQIRESRIATVNSMLLSL